MSAASVQVLVLVPAACAATGIIDHSIMPSTRPKRQLLRHRKVLSGIIPPSSLLLLPALPFNNLLTTPGVSNYLLNFCTVVDLLAFRLVSRTTYLVLKTCLYYGGGVQYPHPRWCNEAMPLTLTSKLMPSYMTQLVNVVCLQVQPPCNPTQFFVGNPDTLLKASILKTQILRSLDLRRCHPNLFGKKIGQFSAMLQKLTQLETLFLPAGCQFIRNADVANLTKLRILHMPDIVSQADDALAPLQQLVELNIRSVKFSPGTLSRMTKLMTLNVSDCPHLYWEELGPLSNLQYLDMSDNPLSPPCVWEPIAKMTDLRILKMSRCIRMQTAAFERFLHQNLLALRELEMANTQIINLDLAVVRMPVLSRLIVCDCLGLSRIASWPLHDLLVLDISGCPLIDNDAMTSFPNLITLKAHRTPKLTVVGINHLTALKHLRLSSGATTDGLAALTVSLKTLTIHTTVEANAVLPLSVKQAMEHLNVEVQFQLNEYTV